MLLITRSIIWKPFIFWSISFPVVWRPVASPPVLFRPLYANCIPELCPTLCEICNQCVGSDFIHLTLFELSKVKGFSTHQLPSSYTDLLHSAAYCFSFLLFRYYHPNCSSDPADCIPSPFPYPRYTKFSTLAHSCAVLRPNARVDEYLVIHFFH